MKKYLHTSLFLSLILIYTGLSAAKDIKINPEGHNRLVVHENTYFHLTATNYLNDIRTLDVNTSRGIFTELITEDYSSTQELGKPELPVSRKLIEIPVNAEIVIHITGSNYQDINMDEQSYHLVMPAQAPVSKNDEAVSSFSFNSQAYQKDAFYPSMPVSVTVLGFMRGLRLGRLDISAVRYNPVTHILRVYKEINFEIIFRHPDIGKTKSLARLNQSPYFSGINHSILNTKSLETSVDSLLHFPVKYVIVADPMYQAALQPFIQWKKKKGFTVIEAYTNDPVVGYTTGSIKTYLQGLYDAGTASDPPPSFILLVGDVNQVPTYNGLTGVHPTDFYYSDYTGDYLPELYVGRFTASTEAMLTTQLNKTLEYEQYSMPDPSFLGDCVMIGGMDPDYGATCANGQINYGTTYYFNTAHGLNSHTYLYPTSGSQSAQIIQDVSNGCCFANYTAHGNIDGWYSPVFLTSNIPSLNNAHKYPLMVGNACLTNKFDEMTDCFGEALVKAVNKGALGYIGGTDNTYWNEDYYWGVGFKAISANPTYSASNLGSYDRTFHDHGEPYSDWYITQGQMVAAGDLAVTTGSPGMASYYWEVYALIGDPSLMIYFSVPPLVNVTYTNPLPLTNTTFTVNTEPYAYAAISLNGVLHGAALANSGGQAVINIIPFNTAGLADVVVTKQNRKPYIGTVSIATPASAMCIYHDHAINDNAGNNNGLVDYGESILLSVGIQNVGSLPGNNLLATLRTQDPYVTLTDSVENYAYIASGGIVTITDGFGFTAGNNIPDGHYITFTLHVTDGNNTWNSTFQVQAHAPVLAYSDFNITDPLGNNNNKPDPGETFNLVIHIQNTGTSPVSNVHGILSTTSGYITINNSNATFGNVAAGGSAQATYSLTASPGTPTGTSATFNLNLVGDLGQTATGSLTMTIGQFPALVIDLDGDLSSGPSIQSAIQANNLACTYTTAMPADLNLYSSVFVCLGVYNTNFALQTDEGQALANYLDNGGNLYLEGGDTWVFDAATPVTPYFHITGLADGGNDLGTLVGIAGTFTEGQAFSYSGENNWIDQIGPAAGSNAFAILNNISPAYTTAVACNSGTYRTIGASHEFAGLTNASFPNTKTELMSRYLEFFGLLSNAVTANFTTPDTAVMPGSNIHFTDQSLGTPMTWSWSFPGGMPTGSTQQNPTVTYLNTGFYNVSLTVTHGLHTNTITKVHYIRAGYSNVSGTVNYGNLNSTPLGNVTVNLKQGNSIIMQTTTNSGGSYSFLNVAPGTYSLALQCSSAWGGVNATDALMIMRHFVGIAPLTGIRLKAGDVDASTVVNSIDAMASQKRSVGLITSFPAGDWAFEQKTFTVDGISSAVQNILGLCYGDVNASYTPSARLEPELVLENDNILVPGKDDSYEIGIHAAQAMEIGAISLNLLIPDHIRVTGVSSGSDQNGNDPVFNITGNHLAISWASLTPMQVRADDVILRITCRIIPGSTNSNSWVLDPSSEISDENAIPVIPGQLKIDNPVIPGDGFSLSQNMPNPFSDMTEIRYCLPDDANVKLSIFDPLGREIQTLVNDNESKGIHSLGISWKNLNTNKPANESAGLYFYRIVVTTNSKIYSDSKIMICK